MLIIIRCKQKRQQTDIIKLQYHAFIIDSQEPGYFLLYIQITLHALPGNCSLYASSL